MTHGNWTRLVTVLAIVVSGVVVIPVPARADVSAMPWAAVGTLTATATFRGKKVVMKQSALGPLALRFGTDGSLTLTGAGMTMTGTWTQIRKKFQIVLDDTTISGLLAGIQDDLSAQSGLRVDLTPLTASFTGTENAGAMKLRGTMTVKAAARYPDYSEKTGRLILQYRFAGYMPM